MGAAITDASSKLNDILGIGALAVPNRCQIANANQIGGMKEQGFAV